ncbi:ribonuclease e inhibitor rraa/dimethylmenaquinone methyltransferase [Niveomyces insectorum RCEF 264]|uniref:Ribonuclease e inhibitor rraa/dimethylmenaquinone methyltransferase n=1 Tax=Niveomyces insectorum RCEF 264 TaxID=1081102 RepID=A0A167NH05_9HYPO|nr:ribonuclease e inhibitor rraa/dimethylmenaquinone methyltransferase [Niveomyces insectorum RCEF 264]
MASDPIVEALSAFTACDVSDALQKLKVPNGGFVAGITMFSPERQTGATKIVGPAYTVKYVPLSDPTPKHQAHYIDSIPAGAVVFISSPQTPNAVFGGLMATRAQYSKAAGTVIDGRLRDLQEHRDLGYPVFARDVSTAAPYEVAKVVGVNVPVQIKTADQDVTIQPGDYIVADINGVVVLPKALAEEVLPLMKKQASADEKVAAALKSGMLFTEASAKFRG